ncbi:MAG: isochorismatase family protein [Candidatus Competibacterales bacterium]
MTTPGLSHRETSLLLVVDVQQRLMPAIAGGEEVIRRCRCLTAIARAVAVPVWATEHYPERIGTLVAELRDHVDSIFAKRHFNAMGEANLAEAMAGRPGEVIVTGAETHVCVYQTVMG